MKKLIAFLLIALLIFTSCSAPKSDYKVEMSRISESGVFKESEKVIQSDVPENEILDVPIESEITLGNKTIVADMTRIWDDENVYVSKDRKIAYTKSKDSDSFTICVNNHAVSDDYNLYYFSGDNLTEAALLENVKSYISNYLDLDMFDDYVYSCSTIVDIKKPDAAWQHETKEEFYVPSDDTEKVRSYVIEYRKYYGDYKTSDNLSVYCDSSGNIITVIFENSNTDWIGGEFDAKSVEKSVEKYLKDNIRSEWKVKDYKISNECLVCDNGKIYLSVSVELIIMKNGTEANTLCALRVSK